ncbi:MAG: cytochrome c-type biogenesis protein CcmH [Solirubrobacteraceae bacterium]|nr:cytochrome c-type biogenesis protein CcmH [Solirubrobacteraceae bacterium]
MRLLVRIRFLVAAIAAVCALVLVVPAASTAAISSAATAGNSSGGAPSVADIEDEVMCVQCGRPLATSSGSAADQERALIQGWIDQGFTKAEIKDKLVDEYGERALVNDRSPIAAAAPWLAALAGITSITLLLRRRRQSEPDQATTSDTPEPEPTANVSAADDARIDAELAHLDGR